MRFEADRAYGWYDRSLPLAALLPPAGRAVFLVILFGLWKHQRRLLPIAVSAAVSLLVWKLVPGVWYIFAGGLAGTATAALMVRPTAALMVRPEA